MEYHTKLQEKLSQLRKRRLEIVKMLNEKADYLSKLHNDTRTVDMVGKGVCIASGLAALAVTPFTGGTSLAYAGSTQLVGTALSIGAQIYENELTRDCLEELQKKLRRDQEDMKEIDELLRNIDDVLITLNHFTKAVKQIIHGGAKELLDAQISKMFEDHFIKSSHEDKKQSNLEEVSDRVWVMRSINAIKFINSLSLMSAASVASSPSAATVKTIANQEVLESVVTNVIANQDALKSVVTKNPEILKYIKKVFRTIKVQSYKNQYFVNNTNVYIYLLNVNFIL